MNAILVLALSLLVAACAAVIPREELRDVDPQATYDQVRKAPAAFAGHTVHWGGVIHGVRNKPDGTYVEVIQTPLNRRGRPGPLDRTRGRFLVLIPGFADPAVYAAGKPLVVVGTVRGVADLPLDQITYAYPVILGRTVRILEPVGRPDVHVGIGVGAVFGH